MRDWIRVFENAKNYALQSGGALKPPEQSLSSASTQPDLESRSKDDSLIYLNIGSSDEVVIELFKTIFDEAESILLHLPCVFEHEDKLFNGYFFVNQKKIYFYSNSFGLEYRVNPEDVIISEFF